MNTRPLPILCSRNKMDYAKSKYVQKKKSDGQEAFCTIAWMYRQNACSLRKLHNYHYRCLMSCISMHINLFDITT